MFHVEPVMHPSPDWWTERDSQEALLRELRPLPLFALGVDHWAMLRALDLQEATGSPLLDSEASRTSE